MSSRVDAIGDLLQELQVEIDQAPANSGGVERLQAEATVLRGAHAHAMANEAPTDAAPLLQSGDALELA